MSQPQWVTSAGNLGTIAEGIYYQNTLLANVPAYINASITCSATNSTTNRISCNSTAELYPGLKIMFSGIVFGGVAENTSYYVLDVYNSTQFSIAETKESTVPVDLTTASGTMIAAISTVCTATNSDTNRITCNSTVRLYHGLEVMFSGTVFGGLSSTTRYFVLEVYGATEFSIAATDNSIVPIALATETGSMIAEFKQHVSFELLAGQLPSGMQISDNGLIVGIPKSVASLQGVPTQVAVDTTSKFTVRAYTQKIINNVQIIDGIRDRTFTLTVTGPNPPEFITPPGTIAEYKDGVLVPGLQIEYYDPDPNSVVTFRLAGGSLPVGLTLSRTGLISGYVAPLAPPDALAGFSRDGQGFSEYPFDFGTLSQSENYEFVVEMSDGVYSQIRTFSIYVFSANSLTADNITITADNTYLTADAYPSRPPIVLNPQGSIGTVRSDNWYAYQFDGIDFDGDQILYELEYAPGAPVLPGLTLDPSSGWLYGYIPNLGLTQLTYNFKVRASKALNPIIYNEYDYNLTIVGTINTDITWLTPSNLGTIANGATSTFYVAAVNKSGLPLQYQLLSGSNSSLPQGLQLLPSGEIAGQVSFNTFALDGGTTTFDVTMNGLGIAATITETTFDMSHTFTVQVTSVNGLVNITKDFTITVRRLYNEPFDSLYIEAMPPLNDRALISELLQNADIFQNDLIYRPTDPNFGIAKKVVYNHAFGLKPATYLDYVKSLYKNHYWKNLTLGEIKVAQARDSTGEVIYEVVYSKIIDDLLNNQGQSVSKEVTLPYPVYDDNGAEIATVYPNSLVDMRDQVIDTVGKVADILPLWMTSEQSDGTVLGFTPAWVIAYAKPGKGEQISYYIKNQFGDRLNLVDFEVDRYELGKLLSKNWNSTTDSWTPIPAQTYFDLESSSLVSWTNNLIQIVNWLNNDSVPLPWVNDLVPNGTQTTFDGNSLKFIEPVDMYSQTQIYDRYLVFPNRNILGRAVAPGGNVVYWVNNNGSITNWINDNLEIVDWINTSIPVKWINNTGQNVIWINDNLDFVEWVNISSTVGWLNNASQNIIWLNEYIDPLQWVNLQGA